MVQIVPTRVTGGITKTRVTKVIREAVTKVIREAAEVSKGGDITPMRTKTRVVGSVSKGEGYNPNGLNIMRSFYLETIAF